MQTSVGRAMQIRVGTGTASFRRPRRLPSSVVRRWLLLCNLAAARRRVHRRNGKKLRTDAAVEDVYVLGATIGEGGACALPPRLLLATCPLAGGGTFAKLRMPPPPTSTKRAAARKHCVTAAAAAR